MLAGWRLSSSRGSWPVSVTSFSSKPKYDRVTVNWDVHQPTTERMLPGGDRANRTRSSFKQASLCFLTSVCSPVKNVYLLKPLDRWSCGLLLSPQSCSNLFWQHRCFASHTLSLSSTGPADDLKSVTMKVTVTFGQTGVVVPCKDGWTVRDLIQQATLRYRKLLEQVRLGIHTTNPHLISCFSFFLFC